MSSHPAAPLLAADLGHLPHTNANGETGIIALPGFNTAGMSEEQAQGVGLLAQGIAEGVIECLESHGYQVLSKDQIKAKVAAEVQTKTVPESTTLHCRRCRQPLVKVDITSAQPKIDVGMLLTGLQGHRCR